MMRATVEWLTSLGHKVSDVNGTTIGIVLDDPDALQATARQLVSELVARGVAVAPCGAPGVCVDGFFDPVAGAASLALMGLDDALLADPTGLRPVEFGVDIRGDRYLVAGAWRREPPRLDVHGVLRVRDGVSLDEVDFVELVRDAEAAEAVSAAAEAACLR